MYFHIRFRYHFTLFLVHSLTGISTTAPSSARGRAEVRYQWKGEVPQCEDLFSTVLKKRTTPLCGGVCVWGGGL